MDPTQGKPPHSEPGGSAQELADEDLLAGLRRAAKDDRESADEPLLLGDDAMERLAARLAPVLPLEAAAAPERKTAPRGGRLYALALPVAAALAIAASAAFFLRTSTASLPSYGVEISGEREVRGAKDETARAHVARGGRVTIVARPLTQVDGAIAARAWITAGGATRPFTGSVDVAERGAVRLVSAPADTELAPGDALLIIAVGRPGSLPADPPSADAASYRRLGVTITVTP